MLVSTIRFAPKYYHSMGIKPKIFLHSQNGFINNDISELDDFSLEEQMKVLRKKYKTIICYPGSISSANGIRRLPSIIQNMRRRDVCFIVVGTGSGLEKLKNDCKNALLKNVYFFDPIPKNEVPKLLNFVDFGFVGGRNWSFLKYGISQNKLFDFMAAGKPLYVCKN